MAYEKHTWACGETITEAKLNNIEDGIEEALECCEGGNLFVKYDHREEVDDITIYYFDKTWQQVHDALVAGRVVTANAIFDEGLGIDEGALDYITRAFIVNNYHRIASVLTANETVGFDILTSPNDYLQITVRK